MKGPACMKQSGHDGCNTLWEKAASVFTEIINWCLKKCHNFLDFVEVLVSGRWG